jgi:hypothetical protein
VGGFAVQERMIVHGCCICMRKQVGPGCPRLSFQTGVARVNSWTMDMRYVAGTLGGHETKALLDAAIESVT